ncbi:sulfatase family protein [Paenibacillus sp. LjRoot56]|uniref:sulfatase family protein n=1 Tax=Paenibacillus sp. LjRoot56 TaxID=3342333 RepID=UPI003ECFF602
MNIQSGNGDVRRQPNILWICTDQQRTDTLGCYGNPNVNTPNIDKLASQGTLFERAYCQSPVCTPSRASFMTGRYPRTTRCRQNGQKLPSDEKLISKRFAEQGYVCGLAGKLHLAPTHPAVCHGVEERGDDGYQVFRWSPATGGTHEWALNEHTQWLNEKGKELKREAITGSRQVYYGEDEEDRQGTWCIEEAAKFIRSNAKQGNKWLFSLNLFDPHHPFDPPKRLLDKYMEHLDRVPLPNYTPGELDNKPVYQKMDSEKAYNFAKHLNYKEMTEYEHKLICASQWAIMEHVDEQIGLLMEVLKQTGELEHTLVLFMSDHGEMLGDHGIYWKGPYFYEPLVKVPLLIAWPGVIQSGVRTSALVELVDLAPTLLDAIQADAAPGIQGKSLWSLLKGEVPHDAHRDSVYCEYYNAQPWHPDLPPHCTMVSDGRYKLVRVHSSQQGELYDLVKDAAETSNLYDDPAYLEMKLQMMELMTDRMAWTVDPLPERQADF